MTKQTPRMKPPTRVHRRLIRIYIGHLKQKALFEHVQNTHPAHVQNLIRAFALHLYIL